MILAAKGPELTEMEDLLHLYPSHESHVLFRVECQGGEVVTWNT